MKKIIHFDTGGVKPICNIIKRNRICTIDKKDVTCKKCKKIIKQSVIY